MASRGQPLCHDVINKQRLVGEKDGGEGGVPMSYMAVVVCAQTLASLQCRVGVRRVFTDQASIEGRVGDILLFFFFFFFDSRV